jgi:hypothetical protein
MVPSIPFGDSPKLTPLVVASNSSLFWANTSQTALRTKHLRSCGRSGDSSPHLAMPPGRWKSGWSPFEKAYHHGEGQAVNSKVMVIIDVKIGRLVSTRLYKKISLAASESKLPSQLSVDRSRIN